MRGARVDGTHGRAADGRGTGGTGGTGRMGRMGGTV